MLSFRDEISRIKNIKYSNFDPLRSKVFQIFISLQIYYIFQLPFLIKGYIAYIFVFNYFNNNVLFLFFTFSSIAQILLLIKIQFLY